MVNTRSQSVANKEYGDGNGSIVISNVASVSSSSSDSEDNYSDNNGSSSDSTSGSSGDSTSGSSGDSTSGSSGDSTSGSSDNSGYGLTEYEEKLYKNSLKREKFDMEWYKSDFYKYIYKKFIKDILKFSDVQLYTPLEWDQYIIDIVVGTGEEDELYIYSEYDMEPYTGVCTVRSKIRRISKQVFLNGTDEYYTGYRCAKILQEMVNFHVMVRRRYGDESFGVGEILNILDNIMQEYVLT